MPRCCRRLPAFRSGSLSGGMHSRRPSDQTFAGIAQSPNAKSTTALRIEGIPTGAGGGLVAAIPAVGWCFGILGLLAGLYVLALEVMAVKGVNQFGWGQAIASLLIPVFAIACCVSIVAVGIIQVLAPQLMDVFNSITTPVP